MSVEPARVATEPRLILENNKPRYGHVLSVLLALGWVGAVFLAAANEPSGERGQTSTAFNLTFFGLGCIWFLIWANGRPAVKIEFGNAGQLILTQRRIFSTRTCTLNLKNIKKLALMEDKDMDGNPYFRVTMTLFDGSSHVVNESHEREECKRSLHHLRSRLTLS